MHTVGRTYARDHGVTLATLMDFLPRTNDPGCSAGFAHGLVTGVAPRTPQPGAAAAVCAQAATRYQRYSCVHGLGHAFMRINGDRLPPALALCRALGPRPRRTAPRAPTTTTGSRSPAPTTPRCPATRSPIRASCAARSRASSCGRAGTARTSTTARRDRGRLAGGYRRALRGPRRPPAGGLRDRRRGHRPAGPG